MAIQDVAALKIAVVSLIKSSGHVSYAVLQRNFPEMFGGMGRHECPDRPWVLHWQGLSDRGCAVIEQLIQEKKIFVWPTSRYTYLLEGVLIALPFAYDVIGTKKASWLPIVFHSFACPDEVFEQVAKSWIRARDGNHARVH